MGITERRRKKRSAPADNVPGKLMRLEADGVEDMDAESDSTNKVNLINTVVSTEVESNFKNELEREVNSNDGGVRMEETDSDEEIELEGEEDVAGENGNDQPETPVIEEDGDGRPKDDDRASSDSNNEDDKAEEDGDGQNDPKLPASDPGVDDINVHFEDPEVEPITREYYLPSGYATINEGKDQIYAKDENGNEIYWINNNRRVYAYKTVEKLVQSYDEHGNLNEFVVEDKVEYPAKDKDGKAVYIYERGYPRYPENLRTFEVILPVDPETGDEMYIPNENGTVSYPTNRHGKQFYRKDAIGNEIPINPYLYAEIYGTQIYPSDNEGNNRYLQSLDNSGQEAAKKKNGILRTPYYAKKVNLEKRTHDEYYPKKFLKEEM